MSEIVKDAVCRGFGDEGPESLGRLELRAVGRQKHQVQTFGNVKVLGLVPAGSVKDKDGAPMGPEAGLLCEGREDGTHGSGGDGRAEKVDGLTGLRPNEGVQVGPLISTA